MRQIAQEAGNPLLDSHQVIQSSLFRKSSVKQNAIATQLTFNLHVAQKGLIGA